MATRISKKELLARALPEIKKSVQFGPKSITEIMRDIPKLRFEYIDELRKQGKLRTKKYKNLNFVFLPEHEDMVPKDTYDLKQLKLMREILESAYYGPVRKNTYVKKNVERLERTGVIFHKKVGRKYVIYRPKHAELIPEVKSGARDKQGRMVERSLDEMDFKTEIMNKIGDGEPTANALAKQLGVKNRDQNIVLHFLQELETKGFVKRKKIEKQERWKLVSRGLHAEEGVGIEIIPSDTNIYPFGGRNKTKSGFAAQFVAQITQRAQQLNAMREFDTFHSLSTTATGKYVKGSSIRAIFDGKSNISKELLYKNAKRIISQTAKQVVDNLFAGVEFKDVCFSNIIVTKKGDKLDTTWIDWKLGNVMDTDNIPIIKFSEYETGLMRVAQRLARSKKEEKEFSGNYAKEFVKHFNKRINGKIKEKPVHQEKTRYVLEVNPSGNLANVYPDDLRTVTEWFAEDFNLKHSLKEQIKIKDRSLHEIIDNIEKNTGIYLVYHWDETLDLTPEQIMIYDKKTGRSKE